MAKDHRDLPPGVPAEQPPSPEGGETSKPPKHGATTVAEHGPLPRVLKELERAPEGCTRFSIRCANYPQPKKYVLAKAGTNAEAEARGHYLKVTGLDGKIDALKKAGNKEPEPPLLIVTDLKD